MNQMVIDAQKFGVLPGSGDCTQALQALLDRFSRDVRIEFAPGRYDLSAEKGRAYHLSLSNSDVVDSRQAGVMLENCENVTLAGNGAEFVFHGHVSTFVVCNSRQITLENFSIDWEIHPSSEGTVVACGEGWFDVAIDPVQYPHHLEGNTLYFDGEGWSDPLTQVLEFDEDYQRLLPGTGDTFGYLPAEKVGNAFRFHHQRKIQSRAGAAVILRHSTRSHPGILVHGSKEVQLTNLRIHATAGLGILSQFSEDLSYTGIVIRANPARGRKVLSCHVDGMHCSNLRGKLNIENCYFHATLDDPINVHGTSTVVDEIVDQKTIIGRFGHKKSFAFPYWALSGDQISLLEAQTMRVDGQIMVESYELLDDFHFRIRLANVLPENIVAGHVMENISAAPTVTIRGCFFGSGRARGLLFSAPKAAIIENNHFEISGSAILMAGDATYWYESGACRDVIIRNNVFDRCLSSQNYQFCGGVISLWPEVHQPDIRYPFHTGIRVEDNTFLLTGSKPAFYASCSGDLIFARNRIIRTDADNLDVPLIETHDCVNVTVKDNIEMG